MPVPGAPSRMEILVLTSLARTPMHATSSSSSCRTSTSSGGQVRARPSLCGARALERGKFIRPVKRAGDARTSACIRSPRVERSDWRMRSRPSARPRRDYFDVDMFCRVVTCWSACGRSHPRRAADGDETTSGGSRGAREDDGAPRAGGRAADHGAPDRVLRHECEFLVQAIARLGDERRWARSSATRRSKTS